MSGPDVPSSGDPLGDALPVSPGRLTLLADARIRMLKGQKSLADRQVMTRATGAELYCVDCFLRRLGVMVPTGGKR